MRRMACPLLLCLLLALTVPASAAPIPERLRLAASPDSLLSPFTGYTRAHWIEIAGRLIAGFLPYFDPVSGMPDFRGTEAESGHFRYTPGFKSESSNAFGRTMILVALYCAGAGTDTVPGYQGSICRPYLTGIIHGTDPADSLYWGPVAPYDAFGSELAQAIMSAPQFFWDPLTRPQQDRLAEWMKTLVHGVGFECNCWYFNTAPVPVLERYGYDYDRGYITEQLERMLSWYSGDGFFIDGGNKAWDYYNFWGFQLFNLFHFQYTPGWRQRFGAQIRRSTDQFMQHLPYFFGADGAPVPFGRSLTYRWAAACPLGSAEAAGLGSLPPGQARRIASGCLQYFWEQGAMSENGLLQPGWFGANAIVAEQYIHRGAPYWAAVGFSPLLLTEDHPFWTAREEPAPADTRDEIRLIPGAQLVLKTNRRRGEVRLYPIGSPRHYQPTWQTGIKYYQHAYSSALGWAAPGEAGPELSQGRSGVSLDGRTWSYRHQPSPVYLSARHNVSTYFADLGKKGSARVVTNTLIGRDGEAYAVFHTYPEPLYLRVAGYGIPVAHRSIPAGEELEQDGTLLRVSAGEFQSVLKMVEGPAGKLETIRLPAREGWNHSHLFGGTGAWPQWTSLEKVPPKTLVIFYTDGARSERPLVPEFSVGSDRMEEGRWVGFEGMKNLVELY